MSALNNNTWRFKNQVVRELTHWPAALCLARMTARGFAVFSWLLSVRPRHFETNQS